MSHTSLLPLQALLYYCEALTKANLQLQKAACLALKSLEVKLYSPTPVQTQSPHPWSTLEQHMSVKLRGHTMWTYPVLAIFKAIFTFSSSVAVSLVSLEPPSQGPFSP